MSYSVMERLFFWDDGKSNICQGVIKSLIIPIKWYNNSFRFQLIWNSIGTWMVEKSFISVFCESFEGISWLFPDRTNCYLQVD